MGGDDLASDDEYIFGSGSLFGESDSDTDSASKSKEINNELKKSSSKKRKGKTSGKPDDVLASSKKRRKKINNAPVSSKSLLVLAGRGIAKDCVESRVKFINTLYSHSMKMNGQTEAETFSFTPDHFYSIPPETNEETKRFQHDNLDAFLRGSVKSMKRLKNWKHECSPMVIIVTLSARRSVELMKGLSSLKLPIAKLFAKHFSVEEQVELLKGKVMGSGGGGAGGKKRSERCYSIAVGTPGRLLTLLRHGREERRGDGLGALRLNHTEVIIFDTHEDSKGFNVCTLKDTSSDLMHFMNEGVISQLERKKSNMAIALF